MTKTGALDYKTDESRKLRQHLKAANLTQPGWRGYAQVKGRGLQVANRMLAERQTNQQQSYLFSFCVRDNFTV